MERVGLAPQSHTPSESSPFSPSSPKGSNGLLKTENEGIKHFPKLYNHSLAFPITLEWDAEFLLKASFYMEI